jgi:uncharacterized NAD-dependent epimerase/dehydratase family protein
MTKKHAIVYAEGIYNCANGKTAHGLVRYSKRYEISCVVDSTIIENDAGVILDGKNRNIPLYNNPNQALKLTNADTFIIGAVSEGGVLPRGYDKAVEWALSKGLDVVSGLHYFISDNPHFVKLSKEKKYKRFYTGEIDKVKSIRIAILGMDSAIGKRTIAVLLNEELKKHGKKSDMIFTGQTGWLQGWKHGIILDAMINDFIAGGIEGAIIDSWKDDRPDFMIIEGQGSLVHPFFPGGFEILAAGKIDGFILVDAPKRPHLDGFPGYPMPDPKRVVRIAELLTEKPLVGIGINKENMDEDDIRISKKKLCKMFNVPVVEPLSDGVGNLVDSLVEINEKK